MRKIKQECSKTRQPSISDAFDIPGLQIVQNNERRVAGAASMDATARAKKPETATVTTRLTNTNATTEDACPHS